MTDNALFDIQLINSALKNDKLALSCAELHGLLSGFACTNTVLDDAQILLADHCNQNASLPKNSAEIATQLFERTQSTLDSADFTFALLLAGEDAPLIEQASALSEWVSAFLSGFGLTGSAIKLSRESKEALADLGQIAQLAVDEDEDEQEQAALFEQILEHVKICVLTLHSDCPKQKSVPTTK
ncbi:MAG: UPF0149 family protein [Enterovibrio sp.]